MVFYVQVHSLYHIAQLVTQCPLTMVILLLIGYLKQYLQFLRTFQTCTKIRFIAVNNTKWTLHKHLYMSIENYDIKVDIVWIGY